jgi:hypothetical protein
MTKAQILEELPRLTPEERYEIRVRLSEFDDDPWLDDDDPLTNKDKKLIETRIEAHERSPDTAIPW